MNETEEKRGVFRRGNCIGIERGEREIGTERFYITETERERERLLKY